MSKGSGGGGRPGRTGGGGSGSENPGLQQIQSQIIAAGGAEKFVKKQVMPNAEMLKQSDFKPVSTSELNSRYKSDIKGAKLIGQKGDVKIYETKSKTTIATIKGDVVGYGKSYTNIARQKESDFAVAKEHQGKGLGKTIMKAHYSSNPEAVKYPGGFTKAGKKTFTSAMKDIQAGKF